jgi:2-polyprenyl-6-methoxyphenol hydroxylase-like FAD-dependent oxidoreductase
MVETRNKQLIIAGGGIGGLAAAIALSRVGVPVTVLERVSEFQAIGAGIQIGPNGLRMLKELGVYEAALAESVLPEELVMNDSITGERVSGVQLGKAFEDRYGSPYILIHRADLHKCLLEACAKQGNIQLCAGAPLENIIDDGETVLAETSDGRNFSGSGLIGADGLWSKTRELIIGDGAPRVSGHIAYRAVLPAEEVPERLRRQAMTVWAGEKLHLVFYPLRGAKLYNLVAVFHSQKYQEGWNAFGDVGELTERFKPAHEDVKLLLEKIESWRMWVLCDREPIKEWSKGRVTLLGDAAHPTLQYLGQGAIMAMEDAVCLAVEVASNPQDLPAAFKSYVEKRYIRTGRVQLMSRVNGEIYHASGVAREIRNKWLSTRSQETAANTFNWLYDEQPDLRLPKL